MVLQQREDLEIGPTAAADFAVSIEPGMFDELAFVVSHEGFEPHRIVPEGVKYRAVTKPPRRSAPLRS
jgi:hypothetical protein